MSCARGVEVSVRRLARRRSDHFSESAPCALARITRYFVVLIALVAGLAAVGVDITSLSIVGGAIGHALAAHPGSANARLLFAT